MFSYVCCCCQTREALINDKDAPKLYVNGFGQPEDSPVPRTPAATAAQSEDEQEDSTRGKDDSSRRNRRSRAGSTMSTWSFRKAIVTDNVDELLKELEDDEPFVEVAQEENSAIAGVESWIADDSESAQIGNPEASSETVRETEEKMGKRKTIKAGMRAIADRGRELFERMASTRKQEESKEEDSPAKIERITISTQRLQSGKWRIFGLHEDVMVKIGLERLDKSFGEEGLMEFPRRNNGKTMLFREPLIKSLLNGSRDLKSSHKGDISAAQGDIKYLSFRQLLKLRVLHIDYDPTRHESTKVQAAFLQSLDQSLFEQLPKTAIGETASLFNVQALRKFGLDLALLVAANDALSSGRGSPSPWWACYLQGQLVYFDVSSFSVDGGFPASGVLEIQDLSKPDGHRRKIDWNVTHVMRENDLSKSVCSFDSDPASFSYGAQGASFTVSRETLATQLGSLRKVSDKL